MGQDQGAGASRARGFAIAVGGACLGVLVALVPVAITIAVEAVALAREPYDPSGGAQESYLMVLGVALSLFAAPVTVGLGVRLLLRSRGYTGASWTGVVCAALLILVLIAGVDGLVVLLVWVPVSAVPIVLLAPPALLALVARATVLRGLKAVARIRR